MKDKSIAVIIPCHNHAAELQKALESLAKQSRMPSEVIVIDDASRDAVEPIVDGFRGILPVRYRRLDENRGAPAARNIGASLTDGEFLLFMDADVELEPDALRKFSDALGAEGDADFAYSNFWWGWKKFSARPWDPDALKRLNFIHTTSLIRRTAFGGFDESLKKFQDWDVWLSLAERGSRGVWLDEFLFSVKPRASGMSAWLPSFIHRIPWPILGWMPKEIAKYREAEKVIRHKHGL
jgi:glycosyltransferase involved in cell wall biosynthesis